MAAERILSELEKPTSIDFIDTSLKDVVLFLAELHAITILIDESALKEESISTDTPINLQIKGIKFRSGLRLVLEPLGLEFVIRNEVMTVTTKTVAESLVETHVYEARHLKHIDPKELVDVIQQTIRPDSWRSAPPKRKDGKPSVKSTGRIPQAVGAIKALPGSLVITHSQRAHEEIADLLEQLARQAPPSDFEKGVFKSKR